MLWRGVKGENTMIILEDDQAVRGDFHLEILRNGKPIEEVHDHNLVVDSGRVRLAELISANSTSPVAYLGIGTSGDEEQASDTELQDQLLLPLTNRSVDGKNARFDFYIQEGQANGMAIREFALFCEDRTMFSHRVRRRKDTGEAAVIEKMDDISIKGYWIIHF